MLSVQVSMDHATSLCTFWRNPTGSHSKAAQGRELISLMAAVNQWERRWSRAQTLNLCLLTCMTSAQWGQLLLFFVVVVVAFSHSLMFVVITIQCEAVKVRRIKWTLYIYLSDHWTLMLKCNVHSPPSPYFTLCVWVNSLHNKPCTGIIFCPSFEQGTAWDTIW